VKHLFKWVVVYKAKKGDKIHFWEDVWVGNISLKLHFPGLYNICDDKEALVMDYWEDEGWEISFRRSLTVRDVEQRGALTFSLFSPFCERFSQVYPFGKISKNGP
jgi:hypothetical protein